MEANFNSTAEREFGVLSRGDAGLEPASMRAWRRQT